MSGNATKTKAGCINARTFHNPHVYQVTNGNTIAANLAHRGETVCQSVIRLLDGARLFLSNGLNDPIVVIIGKISREMQVRIDKTRHNGTTLNVANLIALGNLGSHTRIGNLLIINEYQRILDRSRTGAINELAAYKSIPSHNPLQFFVDI